MDAELPPGGAGMDGTTYLLGTDGQGRDMLSAIFYGLRISLGIGVVSGIVAFSLGLVVGISAAYFGGRFDTLVMRIVDIQLGFPAILIALVLLAVVGPRGGQGDHRPRGFPMGLLCPGLTRGRYRQYQNGVYRGGAFVWRSPRRESFSGICCPNCLPPLIVVCTVQVGNAIALEATLSFLGVGLPVTKPSLGLLIANGYQYMLSDMMWISFFPGIALLITIVSINLVADQLREALNPRSQE